MHRPSHCKIYNKKYDGYSFFILSCDNKLILENLKIWEIVPNKIFNINKFMDKDHPHNKRPDHDESIHSHKGKK